MSDTSTAGATQDQFTDAFDLLLARIYQRLKVDFPGQFTLRDLKRTTEALALLLGADLSQNDAFIEACHYGFTQTERDSASVIRSIMQERESILAVLPDFESLSSIPSASRLSQLTSSISEGIGPFILRLADDLQEPRTKALLSILSTLTQSADAEGQIALLKIAYSAFANDFIRTIIIEEAETWLADAAWHTRQIAVQTLSALYQTRILQGGKTAVRPMEPLLDDEAWAVRQATVEALGSIYPAIIRRGDDANVGSLESALHDRSWVVRKAAARALGSVYVALIEQGSAIDVAPLVQKLEDRDAEVRKAAVEALGVVYPRLVQQGTDVDTVSLETGLRDSNEAVRAASVRALGNAYVALGERGVTPSLSVLESELSSEFLTVRKSAAKALSTVYAALITRGQPVDLSHIELGLDGLIDYIRQATVEALGIIYPPLIDAGFTVNLKRLEDGLNDDYWAVRQATVEALGSIYPAIIRRGDDANVGSLESALHDRSWVVRKAAARALGSVYVALIEQGRDVDTRTLERALSESNGAIRHVSTNAIGRTYLQLIEHEKDVDVSPLVQKLRDGDAEVRKAAVEALGVVYPRLIQHHTFPHTASLQALLEDTHAASRRSVVRALGNIYVTLIEHEKDVDVSPLVQKLRDGDAEVRKAAVEALGMFCLRAVDVSASNDVLIQTMQRTLGDESTEVRATALRLLDNMARAVLSDPHGEVAGVMKDLERELSASLSSPLPGRYSSFVRLSADRLQVGPLSVHREDTRAPLQPCVMTRSAFAMLKTIALASLLQHPLLLMGPTSTGKSFLIKWLAEALGFEHVSYTINPYISKSELIGGIKPDKQGTFTWQDGIILTAAKTGTWLVLEEINLATSEVLEILNDYLITGKFLYSENGEQRLVEPSDRFRLFATANPLSYAQRERLSQVFLSRFKIIYQEELSEEDLIEVLSELFNIPAHLAYSIAFFHITLQEQAESKIIGSEEKEPYIFSLRDIIRLGKRLAAHVNERVMESDLLRALAVELHDVYLARIRDPHEKDALIKLIDTLFGLKARDIDISEVLKVYAQQYEALLPSLPVTSGERLIPGDEAQVTPTPTQANTLAHVLKALMFSEPILLVGYPASGKTTLIRYLARAKGTDLYYVNLSSDSGLEELLGGFVQDGEGRWRYQRGLLFAAIERGAWLMIDEANLNPLSEYLNTLLDFGYATDEEGTVSHMHPRFRLFLSINPPKVHPSRNVLSPALRTRFNEIWVEETSDVRELSGLVRHWKRSP